MKAWSVTDDEEYLYTTIVFAETRGQARVIARSTDACEDVDFIHIRALRRPQLDKYYRGEPEMDWNNDEDRIAMVKDGMYCSYEVDVDQDKCERCPAHRWCSRYEEVMDGGSRWYE